MYRFSIIKCNKLQKLTEQFIHRTPIHLLHHISYELWNSTCTHGFHHMHMNQLCLQRRPMLVNIQSDTPENNT